MPSDIMAHSVARQSNVFECYIREWPSGSDEKHIERTSAALGQAARILNLAD